MSNETNEVNEKEDWIVGIVRDMEEELRTRTPEDHARYKKMTERYTTVRNAIRAKHPAPQVKGGGDCITGSIPCPLCKDGLVAYIISDHSNGHICAECSTPYCISWHE